jgi:hypothetical protein
MKRQTARVLRGVLRLIEDDLREIADSVVQIDEREASNAAFMRQANLYGISTREMVLTLSERLSDVEAILAEHARRVQS